MRPQPDAFPRFQRDLDFLGKCFRPGCSIGLQLGAA
jgi:hypothetical protein